MRRARIATVDLSGSRKNQILDWVWSDISPELSGIDERNRMVGVKLRRRIGSPHVKLYRLQSKVRGHYILQGIRLHCVHKHFLLRPVLLQHGDLSPRLGSQFAICLCTLGQPNSINYSLWFVPYFHHSSCNGWHMRSENNLIMWTCWGWFGRRHATNSIHNDESSTATLFVLLSCQMKDTFQETAKSRSRKIGFS